MLPLIKCKEHEKDIVFINLNQHSDSKRRIYCHECMNDQENVQPCSIENIPDKIADFSSEMIEAIKLEYDFPIDKMERIKKSLITFKDNLIDILDKMITQTDLQLQSLKQKMEHEQDYFKKLMNDMSRTKLEEIALWLGGNLKRDSKKTIIKGQLIQFRLNAAKNFKQIIQLQKDCLKQHNSLMDEQYFLRSYSKYSNECNVFDNNISQQMIVGGMEKYIMIWKYDKLNIYATKIETQNKIEQIVISQDGSILVSVNIDSVIEKWMNKDNQWNCKQVINLKRNILDLKISPDQNFLIAVYLDLDKTVKIYFWRIDTNNEFQNVQTLCYKQFCIYSRVGFSQNSQFLAISYGQGIRIYQLSIDKQKPYKIFGFVSCLYNPQYFYLTNSELIHISQFNGICTLHINPLDNLSFSKRKIKEVGIISGSDDIALLYLSSDIFSKVKIETKANLSESFCLPKSSWNNQLLIRDSLNLGNALLISMNNERRYLIDEFQHKEFINFQSDNSRTIILRNNKARKQIEIYQQY